MGLKQQMPRSKRWLQRSTEHEVTDEDFCFRALSRPISYRCSSTSFPYIWSMHRPCTTSMGPKSLVWKYICVLCWQNRNLAETSDRPGGPWPCPTQSCGISGWWNRIALCRTCALTIMMAKSRDDTRSSASRGSHNIAPCSNRSSGIRLSPEHSNLYRTGAYSRRYSHVTLVVFDLLQDLGWGFFDPLLTECYVESSLQRSPFETHWTVVAAQAIAFSVALVSDVRSQEAFPAWRLHM